MKFRGIRRFFESFRNIITNLRKKPPSNEKPTEEEATPTRGKKNASPLIGEEDLEIIKSGPTLDNTMAKDRIGIKPKKNHPKQIPASEKALFEDDQSETASTTSRNLIGPEDDFSEEKKVETPEEALAVPMKYTVKQTDEQTDIAGSPKSQERVASPIFGNGDVFSNDNETKDNDITEDASSRSNKTQNKNSSINSLASSRISKSLELFEEERFKKMKEQSDQKKSLSSLKIQDSSSRADETSQSENVSDEMQSSKVSLNESATSVSGSNDVELPTTVEAISSPKFKSPIPTPRKSKTMESSLSSSDSLKSPVDGNGDHRSSSSSSSSSSSKSILKSSKSSLNSRELTPKLEGRVKSSSSMNSQDGKKITRKLSNYKEELNGDDDDEVGGDGEDPPQKDEPKTPHLATPSGLIEMNSAAFCFKPANKSSLKFQNLLTCPSADLDKSNKEFDCPETLDHLNSEAFEMTNKKEEVKSPILKPLPSMPLKWSPSVDEIKTKPIKSPEVPLKPEKLHFKFSESGDGAEGEGSSEVKVESLKSPEVGGKPDKLRSKVPPAVPTKPKFTKI